MKAGIMQSYFFPYLGYFQLIDAVDIFHLYEHVSFRKKSFITKNNILDKGRKIPVAIKVPIAKKSSFKTIKEIEIQKDNTWKKQLLKLIYFNYKKAAYFEAIYPLIEKSIMRDETSLHRYNSKIIIDICNYLNINTSIKFDNDDMLDMEKALKENTEVLEEIKSKRILNICKKIGANTYINPIGGIELYDKDYFQQHNMELFFIEAQIEPYKQFDNEYTPYLSIIDVLMHQGKEGSQKMIKQHKLI
jgi:hypothetical protein